jgi:hypothetical protein
MAARQPEVGIPASPRRPGTYPKARIPKAPQRTGAKGGELPLAERQEQAGKRAYTSFCKLKRSARSLGVDELGVDAYSALVALDRASKHVADAETP